MAAQVALKRQQAAEDAIALGLRVIAGESSGLGYLPPGPVWPGNQDQTDSSMKLDVSTNLSDRSSSSPLKSVDDNVIVSDSDPETLDGEETTIHKPTNVPQSKKKVFNSNKSLNSNNSSSNVLPSDYRPGRLSHMEILARLFPYQRKEVLELVLQGCSGDIVKAIDHFLCADDAIRAHQNMGTIRDGGNNEAQNGRKQKSPSLIDDDESSRVVRKFSKSDKCTAMAAAEQKSAFTPLNNCGSPVTFAYPANPLLVNSFHDAAGLFSRNPSLYSFPLHLQQPPTSFQYRSSPTAALSLPHNAAAAVWPRMVPAFQLPFVTSSHPTPSNGLLNFSMTALLEGASSNKDTHSSDTSSEKSTSAED